MSEHDTGPDHKPLRLYGRRKGKRLRPGRQRLLDTALDNLRLDAAGLSHPIEPQSLFHDQIHSVWLEIGFGGGEHLAAQAKANPDVGFIGSEVFENGIASLLRYCEDDGLTNIRIFDDDVRTLIPNLAAGTLERIFLLFPDPWPKARHAKRRFIATATLDALARVMAPGAELRIATDHPTYARWCLRHIPPHPAFLWPVTGPQDWRCRPAEGRPTRYEEKAVRQGRRPMYLNFLRSAAD